MLRGRAGDWNSKSPQLQVSLFDLFGGGVSDVKPVPQLLGSQVTEAVVEDDRMRAQLLADDFALVLEEMRVDPLAGDDINFLVVLLVEDFQADVALFREEFPPERSTRPGYNMR